MSQREHSAFKNLYGSTEDSMQLCTYWSCPSLSSGMAVGLPSVH